MSSVVQTYDWPRAQIVSVIDHELRLFNDTQHPIYIPKHEQLCNIRSTQVVDSSLCQSKPSVLISPIVRAVQTSFSKEVQIDPHKQLPPNNNNNNNKLHLLSASSTMAIISGQMRCSSHIQLTIFRTCKHGALVLHIHQTAKFLISS